MDLSPVDGEVSYFDIMTTKEHMDYILNYPEKPLISNRY